MLAMRQPWALWLGLLLREVPHGAAAPNPPLCDPHALLRAELVTLEGDELLPWTESDCPWVRKSYRCRVPTKPRKMLSVPGCRIAPYAASTTPFPPDSKTLLTGNSFQRELFESLLCQYRSAVTSVASLVYFVPDVRRSGSRTAKCGQVSPVNHPIEWTWTLQPPSSGIWKDGVEGPGVFMTDNLARVTFRNGAELIGAFNGNFLFHDLDWLLARLQLTAGELDFVVLKPPNVQEWANTTFAECPWFAERAPHLRRGETVFNTSHVVARLHALGFRGTILASKPLPFNTALARRLFAAKRLFTLPSATRNTSSFSCTCGVPLCHDECGHQCLPGPTVDLEAHLVSHTLRWVADRAARPRRRRGRP